MKSKFEEVMDAISSVEKFSWNFNGITGFRNTDRLVHVIPNPNEASIGWIMQQFCNRALYDSSLLISFESSPEGLKIYYK